MRLNKGEGEWEGHDYTEDRLTIRANESDTELHGTSLRWENKLPFNFSY